MHLSVLTTAVLTASLIITPALANEFAPCGYIKSKHPTVECYAAELPGGRGLIGYQFTDKATGKKFADVYMTGPGCKDAGKGIKFDMTGQFQQRKKIGNLKCDPKSKILTFNGNPIILEK